MSIKSPNLKGFTIVELIIVIVVIGILAAIGYIGYSKVQDEARTARSKAEASTLIEAIEVARNKTRKSLTQLTGTGWTGQYCQYQPAGAPNPGAPIPAGTDFSAQTVMTQRCWTDYQAALQKISDASGIDITTFKDPWGRPYYIDENEQETGTFQCSGDVIFWLKYPFSFRNVSDWEGQIFVPPYKSTCY